MYVGNEGQCGRDVQCLTETHYCAQGIQFPIGIDISHEECHCRPYEEAAHDKVLAVHAVGDSARDGAHKTVYPHECSHQGSPAPWAGITLGNLNDILGHVETHGAEHLTVHVVKERHAREQYHH